MAVTTFLPVAQVRRRDDARVRDDAAVQFLADSMREVGQITPILVRPMDEGFELIAGSHRLAAADLLGWSDILAIYAEHGDDLHAELAMIDENLCRSELSPAESAAQLARRKAIYEELHPETRHGGERASRQLGDLKNDQDNNEVERFSANAAAATGRSERAVQRDTERGEKILPEVLQMLHGTKLNTGAYLDKIKKLPPNDQYKAVTRDLALSRRADAAEKTSREKGKAGAKPPAEAEAAGGTGAHERLLAALDMLNDVVVADVLSQCPPRERAALCQRASSAIDLLGNVMEGASS